MVGILLDDDTSIWFDQNKYHTAFDGMTVIFGLKKEFYPSVNRQTRIIVDYANKTVTSKWEGGFNAIEKFKRMM